MSMFFEWLPYALQFQSTSQKAGGMSKEASHVYDLQTKESGLIQLPDSNVYCSHSQVTKEKNKDRLTQTLVSLWGKNKADNAH